jgi:DNA-binding HxlR family transcriptional regulator
MEEQGLVSRQVFAEVPPRVEYELTQTGYSLQSVLDSLSDWGSNYQRQCQKN